MYNTSTSYKTDRFQIFVRGGGLYDASLFKVEILFYFNFLSPSVKTGKSATALSKEMALKVD